jgi:hypothetical protein
MISLQAPPIISDGHSNLHFLRNKAKKLHVYVRSGFCLSKELLQHHLCARHRFRTIRFCAAHNAIFERHHQALVQKVLIQVTCRYEVVMHIVKTVLRS